MNSQPSSVSTRSMTAVGGGAPPTTMRMWSRPGVGPGRSAAAVRMVLTTAGAPPMNVTPLAVDAPEDLRSVDLAQHHVRAAHPGDRVHHPPAVAVEHRHGPQVDVAIAHAGVPAERERVDVEVAVRQLHPLRSGRRAARVVDRRDGVLAGVDPRVRLAVEPQQRGVGLAAEHEPVRRIHVGERIVELGIDEEHGRTGLLDDVADLLGVEPEVDRHDDTPVAGHREQGDEEAGAVLRDDRHALAGSDAEGVEAGGHGPGVFGDLPPRQSPPAVGGLVRLVDHTDAVAVDVLGAIEEVEDVERSLHRVVPE